MSEYQQNIVRLVRRRIQNKIAAQTARRRKMDYLNSLRTEVEIPNNRLVYTHRQLPFL